MTSKQHKKADKIISTMLCTGEVARIFGVNTETVRRWNEKGHIKSYRIGPRSERRFLREDVAVLYLDRAIRKYIKSNVP